LAIPPTFAGEPIFFRPAFSYVLKLREDNIFWLSPQLLQVSHFCR